jgi:hypothetical protein
MMTEENLARLRAHRNNIHRYCRLLRTHLTELERQYIENRLSAELEAASRVSHVNFALDDDPFGNAEVWNWKEGGLGSPSVRPGLDGLRSQRA